MIHFTKTAKSFMFLTALVAWIGLGIQQYLIIDNIPQNGMTVAGAIGRFLTFFTVLTNLLIAICLTVILVSPASGLAKFFSRASVLAALTIYILLVGLTYNVILRQLWQPVGWHRVCDEILHVIVPVLFTLFWVLFVPKGRLAWINILYWLIYPGLYLIYALALGNNSGFYAYPFIDVSKIGYSRVAINSAGIMGLLVITGLIIVAVDKRMARTIKLAA